MALDLCCPLRHSILCLTFLSLTLLCANVTVFNFNILLLHIPPPPSNLTTNPPYPASSVNTQYARLEAKPSASSPTQSPPSSSPPPAPTRASRLFTTEPPEPPSTKTTMAPTTLAPPPSIFNSTSLLNQSVPEQDLLAALQTMDKLNVQVVPAYHPPAGWKYFHQEKVVGSGLKASLYSSAAWGSVLALGPVCLAAEKLGLRVVLVLLGLASGLATVCAHGLVHLEPAALLAVRVVQGAGTAAIVPAAAAAIATWASIREFPAAITLFFAVEELGAVLAFPLAALIAQTPLGWAGSVYALGFLTLILVLLWCLFYRDAPRSHGWLSGLELDRILERKVIRSGKARVIRRPWARIFTSSSTYLALISAFGYILVLQLLLLFTPLYLNIVLGYNQLESGLFAAVPMLICFFSKILAASIFELNFLSPSPRVRVLGGIAHLGSGLCLGAVGFAVRAGGTHLALILLCLSATFLGLHAGGWLRAVLSATREQAPSMLALIALMEGLVGTVLPYLVMELGSDEKSWRLLWLVGGGVAAATGAAWAALGSARPESWTRGLEKAFKGAPKLFDATGPEDDDAISIDQGIIELKRVDPVPSPSHTADPERVPLHRVQE